MIAVQFAARLKLYLEATIIFKNIEYKNEKFIQILKKNLKNEIRTFFFADEVSKTTGGYDYWKYEIDKIIHAFQQKSKTKEEEAREYVLKNLVMIESLSYHSYESPSLDLEQIPSSKMNRKYVHDVLLEKVKQNKVMLFAWRKVRFWSLPEHKNILTNVPQNSLTLQVPKQIQQPLFPYVYQTVV